MRWQSADQEPPSIPPSAVGHPLAPTVGRSFSQDRSFATRQNIGVDDGRPGYVTLRHTVTVDVRRFLLSVAAASVGGSAVVIGQSSVDPPPDRPEPGERVLVVAFTNITGAPADAWIGEGIAETVSTDLERLQGLAVVGHRAWPSLDDAAMIDAGRRLGAQWVLGGGYQHVAERLRLTAQLVHVDTARVVYTAKVDGVIGDLFELQDRLVAASRPRRWGSSTVQLLRLRLRPSPETSSDGQRCARSASQNR